METALHSVYREISHEKGAILSSGFDYPGRHSRWDMGFVRPAAEFISAGRSFEFRALRAEGLPAVRAAVAALENHPYLTDLTQKEREIHGEIALPGEDFSEEERSREPSVFSVLRALIGTFYSEDPAGAHFGLYGTFGYDLIFQFEHIEKRHKRSPTAVDHVEGTLKEEFDGLDAFQTHMWACTVTGSPKPAAIQEIENLENSPRGWYSGAVGVCGFNGDINTGIMLRTAQLKDGYATIRSGATLLHGSDPEAEEQETRTKAAAFLSTVAGRHKKRSSSTEAAPTPTLARSSRVLLVDYRDSFVHNLASYLRELGATVTTCRPNLIEKFVDRLHPEFVVLSPGPGTPEDFGMHAHIEFLLKKSLPLKDRAGHTLLYNVLRTLTDGAL